MGQELVAVDLRGKSLRELLSPLTISQQEYLILRLRGVSGRETLELMQRTYPTVSHWNYDDPSYRVINDYLIDHAGEYRGQANEMVNAQLAVVEYGLIKLAQKIADWGRLKRSEKAHVLKAVDMLRKTSPHHGTSSERAGESYDELILRSRRVREDK